MTSCLLIGDGTFPKMGSTLKGKNLLLLEQILSFMGRPQFIWESTMKMTELFPLKMYWYPFT